MALKYKIDGTLLQVVTIELAPGSEGLLRIGRYKLG